MKKKVKIIGGIVILVCLFAYALVMMMMPMAVETKTLISGDSEISFIESGVVVNSGEQIIFPMTSGEVSDILVKEGDFVEKGAVLARLNSSAMAYQVLGLEKNVESIEAQMASAEIDYQNNMDSLRGSQRNLEGQLQQLKAESGSSTSRELEQLLVDQSRTLYDRGLEDLEKQRELFELGYISEATYNEFSELVDSYEANYKANLIRANAGDVSYSGMKSALLAQIESIESALERDTLTPLLAYNQAMLESSVASLNALKVQVGYYDITSSIDGVVDEIMIENVNRVTGASPAFIVQGKGSNKIVTKINTRDMDVVHVNDQVELILDRRTGDLEVAGTIVHIATSATVEVSPLGVEERKVQVIIDPEDQTIFASGYDVDVKFIIYSEPNQLAVPNSALYSKDEEDMLMVIRGGLVREVAVELGVELVGETIINSGVEIGEQVITDIDAKGLKIGARVKSSNE